MMMLELPKSVKGNGPTMTTLVEVGQVLEAAKGEPPLSLAEIERRMKAKRVRHAAVRASVDFLERLGFVTLGSQGVQWTHTRDERFWEAARKGPSLLGEA
jgi:Fe2+ or Zn2+ uptake regulation protein